MNKSEGIFPVYAVSYPCPIVMIRNADKLFVVCIADELSYYKSIRLSRVYIPMASACVYPYVRRIWEPPCTSKNVNDV
jgi:hypothetical protein